MSGAQPEGTVARPAAGTEPATLPRSPLHSGPARGRSRVRPFRTPPAARRIAAVETRAVRATSPGRALRSTRSESVFHEAPAPTLPGVRECSRVPGPMIARSARDAATCPAPAASRRAHLRGLVLRVRTSQDALSRHMVAVTRSCMAASRSGSSVSGPRSAVRQAVRIGIPFASSRAVATIRRVLGTSARPRSPS